MRIFISYRKSDKAKVQELSGDLTDMGHMVWYDKEIQPGHEWWRSILGAILDCDLFVVALSPDWLESEPCQREQAYGSALQKRILPVMIVPISANQLPMGVAKVQYVDYCNQGPKEAYKSLQKALGELPPMEPLPDPLPNPPAEPISEINSAIEKINRVNRLSDDEQWMLVGRLKMFLSEPRQANDALDGLRRLRKRPELLGQVRDDIDVVLEKYDKPAPVETKPLPIRSTAENRPDTQGAYQGAGGVLPSQLVSPTSAPTKVNWAAMVIGVIAAYFYIFGVAHFMTGKKNDGFKALAIGGVWFVVSIIFAIGTVEYDGFTGYAVFNQDVFTLVTLVNLGLGGYLAWRGAKVVA